MLLQQVLQKKDKRITRKILRYPKDAEKAATIVAADPPIIIIKKIKKYP